MPAGLDPTETDVTALVWDSDDGLEIDHVRLAGTSIVFDLDALPDVVTADILARAAKYLAAKETARDAKAYPRG